MKSNASELVDVVERVRPRLGRIGSPFHHYASVGSTNDVAAGIGTEGAVVVADAQTGGRGRRGRSWFSPPLSGLYVSVVLAPGRSRVDPRRATTLLTLAVGVAIAEGLQAATGLSADLKWPNDVYVGRRKLAGILAESITAAQAPVDLVVVGYGVNVGADAYPPELLDRVTSLESELGRSVDRASVLAETLAAIGSRYDDLLEGRFDAILDAWRSRAPGASGARVEWTTTGGIRTGITDGIDADGALRVRSSTGVDRIVGGELRWR